MIEEQKPYQIIITARDMMSLNETIRSSAAFLSGLGVMREDDLRVGVRFNGKITDISKHIPSSSSLTEGQLRHNIEQPLYHTWYRESLEDNQNEQQRRTAGAMVIPLSGSPNRDRNSGRILGDAIQNLVNMGVTPPYVPQRRSAPAAQASILCC